MERSIEIRNIRFRDLSSTPRYWFDGNAAETHFMNALSTTFPEGEALFVRSVQYYQDRIEDPKLRADIRAFSGQEGVHAREHDAHVEMLVAQGYPGIARLNEMARRESKWLNRNLPKASLAITAALEHITAIMAHRALVDPEYWGGRMHPNMAPLWQWHAMEEAEHKAVAFDVLALVSGSYALRAAALIVAGMSLMTDNLVRFAYLTYRDGNLFKPRIWADLARFVWGREGLYRSLVRDYFEWFRPGFHPWQRDDQPLIEAQKQRLESILAA